MLIVGAKGFAKEVLEVLYKNNQTNHLYFFDNGNQDIGEYLFDKYPIIKSISDAHSYIKNVNSEFTIGIGNPILRKRMYDMFDKIGGQFTSVISHNSEIGSYNVKIGEGCNILPNVVISNGSVIGVGCLLYFNSIVTHDCSVGDFVELSPGATLLGRVIVGNNSQIGANATILPDIRVGANVVVGAGAVVTKDLPDNSIAVGVPAKVIKYS